jgi:hypothetical protein
MKDGSLLQAQFLADFLRRNPFSKQPQDFNLPQSKRPMSFCRSFPLARIAMGK